MKMDRQRWSFNPNSSNRAKYAYGSNWTTRGSRCCNMRHS